MAEVEDIAFDRIMELVGNDGKFQKVFNHFFNVGLVMFASMAYMNIVMVLNEPEHTCHVPGRSNFNVSADVWRNLTLPIETDNRDVESYSACKMYNVSSVIDKPMNEWNFTKDDTISCVFGYDYDTTYYDRTIVTDEDWICDNEMYQTNSFVFNRIGEVVGTFIFGQLGDTLGRRPVFYFSTVIIILGRVMTVFTTSTYWLFAIAAVLSMLTSMSIFLSPLIIAMETSKEDDRAHIAMMQCLGWTLGMCVMPMVFWYVKDWVWFLMLTTLPCGLFAMFPKYMIESPRWLATKRHLKRCAIELNKIAKINGKDVEITEKTLKEMLPNVQVEEVYGIASLFSGWRLAKNTLLIIICWLVCSLSYFVLVLNSTRMGGNPFLSFLYQSIIELPAYIIGRAMGDKIGRRLTNFVSFLGVFLACFPIVWFVKDPQYEILTSILVVFIKFSISIAFFAVNLQAMETYPTCLRQSGISIGAIVANSFGVLGPYIVYLGTNYDVRYPYMIISGLTLIGVIAASFLPETLHQKLANTIQEAQKFGKHQKFWSMPHKKPASKDCKEMEKLNPDKLLTATA